MREVKAKVGMKSMPVTNVDAGSEETELVRNAMLDHSPQTMLEVQFWTTSQICLLFFSK